MVEGITITIDGCEIVCEPGQRLLDVALRAGVHIPHLCYWEGLTPFAGCRTCVVEIEGMRGTPTSCTTTVSAGMKVTTVSPPVDELRHGVMEYILCDHPGRCFDCHRLEHCGPGVICLRDQVVTERCLTCAKNRFCELQEVAEHINMRGQQRYYEEKQSWYGADMGGRQVMRILRDNPFIELEFDKCILCTRCVRVCDEIRGRGVFTLSYRGPEAKIGTAFDLPMFQTGCEFCGACVDVCPTAAIMDRRTKWSGIPAATVRTTCPHCSIGCQLKLEVGQGRVVSARPLSNYPVDEGQICARGRYGMEFIHGPERLTTPLVRGPEGLRPASWEEAMRAVAAGLAGRRGGAFAALGGGRLTNEEAYLLQKLTRSAMGSNNVDRVGRLSGGADGARTTELMGVAGLSTAQASIGQARSFRVVGSDISEDHPVIGVGVIEGVRRRGARLVVAHPRRIELLDLCGFGALHLQYRPGTEAALLGGMVRLILDEGLEDEAFIDTHCEGLAELRASLRDGYEVEECARLTGVPAADIAEAARVLAQERPAAILSGLGLTGPVSDAALQALADLALVTGNYGGPVGGLHVLREAANAQGADDMGLLPHRLPGYRALDDEGARSYLEGFWGCSLPREPGRGVQEILAAAASGDIKALYVVGADPLGDARLGGSIQHLEFLVVQDHTLTETARLAHVVLPGATFAEKEGSFTSNERRVQLVRPAIDPPGEALADWRVLCRVAEALGAEGFAYAGPGEVMAEIGAACSLYAGLGLSGQAGAGVQWPAGPDAHGGTPCLAPGQLQGGRGRLWSLPWPPFVDVPDAEYPLMLSLDGWMGRGPADGAVVEVGSGSADDLGLVDGASVEVEGRSGRLAARVRVLEELPADTARLLRGDAALLAAEGLSWPRGGVRVRKL